MSITMIWAMDSNHLIGKQNRLPWRIPHDMAFFRRQTLGKTVVLGRKTWDSFNQKSLPQRRNIVMTRDQEFKVSDAELVHSIEEVLDMAKQEEIMIIGGGEIYKLFWPHADKLLVTRIHEEFEGDSYFPELDWSSWRIADTTPGIKDEKNPYDYEFITYVR
ncbi:dihydrofolate reductase [Paenibacillus massiliensis]|uniref:dihydrofolate reductase n=1 Tax=Paenibacillus massiliensis TaxID=225917 RepID=UPI00035CD001|nr:dihydrofolate reductase [Paenibacillus massiliensis]